MVISKSTVTWLAKLSNYKTKFHECDKANGLRCWEWFGGAEVDSIHNVLYTFMKFLKHKFNNSCKGN